MRKRRDIKSILLIAGIVIIFIILGFQVIIGSQGFLSKWLQLKVRKLGEELNKTEEKGNMYKDIVEEVKVAYEEVSEYPEESELKAF